MASASSAGGKQTFGTSFKKFLNLFGPPLAGCAVGWTVWGAGESVAPEKMHGTAIAIHNFTYKSQEFFADNILPRSVASAMVKNGVCIPPPVNILEQDRDEENQARSETMFREIFEQCRMNEGLDWLEENITDEIPFIYINELFATWGSIYFWKHFLRKQHKKTDPKSEGGLESSHAQDMKALSKRVRNDFGDCDLHIAGGETSSEESSGDNNNNDKDDSTNKNDDEQNNNNTNNRQQPRIIKIKSGGEAFLLEGIWRRFATMDQLDSIAGWTTLAVLTQNKQNALALAKIALVSSLADSSSSSNAENEKIALGNPLTTSENERYEKSKTLLCDSDRCLWALGTLMKTGIQMWKKTEGDSSNNNDGGGAALVSEAALSRKPYLLATASISPEEELKEAKRNRRKEQMTGKQNPYAAEEEAEFAEGGVYRDEKENREFIKLVFRKFDEITKKQSKKDTSSSIDPELVNPDHIKEHEQREEGKTAWEIETERRWAIASADPFLITLRNVDVALCDYLKKREDEATTSRWYDLLGLGGSKESRCPALKHHLPQSCNENEKKIVEKYVLAQGNKNNTTDNKFSSLVPALKSHFKNSMEFSQLFSSAAATANDEKKKFILGEYVGNNFAKASEPGSIPLSSSSADSDDKNKSPPAILSKYLLADEELMTAAGFLKKQSAVVKDWIKEDM